MGFHCLVATRRYCVIAVAFAVGCGAPATGSTTDSPTGSSGDGSDTSSNGELRKGGSAGGAAGGRSSGSGSSSSSSSSASRGTSSGSVSSAGARPTGGAVTGSRPIVTGNRGYIPTAGAYTGFSSRPYGRSTYAYPYSGGSNYFFYGFLLGEEAARGTTAPAYANSSGAVLENATPIRTDIVPPAQSTGVLTAGGELDRARPLWSATLTQVFAIGADGWYLLDYDIREKTLTPVSRVVVLKNADPDGNGWAGMQGDGNLVFFDSRGANPNIVYATQTYHDSNGNQTPGAELILDGRGLHIDVTLAALGIEETLWSQ